MARAPRHTRVVRLRIMGTDRAALDRLRDRYAAEHGRTLTRMGAARALLRRALMGADKRPLSDVLGDVETHSALELPTTPDVDTKVLRSVFTYLRTAFDDLTFVTEDLLRPPRERFWGHLTHVEKYEEARHTIDHDIDAAIRLLDAADDEPPWEQGDPSGSGGSPAH